MRDIKFRAWHELNKRMIDLKAITPLALNLDTDGLFIPFSDGLKLMQFTGLKDKNGKEIYEGDIVKDDSERIWLIEWQQPIARFVFTLQDSNRKKFNGRIGKPTRTTLQAYLTERDELIGNIYENPELIPA